MRKLYNDITFIDEFFTARVLRRAEVLLVRLQRAKRQLGDHEPRVQEGEGPAAAQLTNCGQPVIDVEDGNFENRGELLLRHNHEGIDLDGGQARDTLRNASKLWTRPVSLLTKVDGKGKLLRCEDGNISERSAEYR